MCGWCKGNWTFIFGSHWFNFSPSGIASLNPCHAPLSGSSPFPPDNLQPIYQHSYFTITTDTCCYCCHCTTTWIAACFFVVQICHFVHVIYHANAFTPLLVNTRPFRLLKQHRQVLYSIAPLTPSIRLVLNNTLHPTKTVTTPILSATPSSPAPPPSNRWNRNDGFDFGALDIPSIARRPYSSTSPYSSSSGFPVVHHGSFSDG